MTTRDVFICHASADKERIARPLAAALARRGVSCWVDEATLTFGDSLMAGINEGLSRAASVILLITEDFVGRPWPEREMAAALSLDLAGRSRLLPVSDVPREVLIDRYPLIADTVGMEWRSGPDDVADAVAALFPRQPSQDWVFLHEKIFVGPIWTRITPAPGSLGRSHSVTIRWGDWIWRREFSDVDASFSLTHFKERADEHRMFVEIVPSAIVTIGQGRPPDHSPIDINEGWTRPVGWDASNIDRVDAKQRIEETSERVEWHRRLRAEYLASHPDADPEIVSGNRAIPAAWLRRRGEELGIAELLGFDSGSRQESSRTRASATLARLSAVLGWARRRIQR